MNKELASNLLVFLFIKERSEVKNMKPDTSKRVLKIAGLAISIILILTVFLARHKIKNYCVGVVNKAETVMIPAVDANQDLADQTSNTKFKIDDNVPDFVDQDLVLPKKKKQKSTWIYYSNQDSAGRPTQVDAILDQSSLPKKPSVKPVTYTPVGFINNDNMPGKVNFTRGKLLNNLVDKKVNVNDPRNVFTATNFLESNLINVMEKKTISYLKTNLKNHVRYRAKLVYKDGEIIARGVQIEAQSIEDRGSTSNLSFNVYLRNMQSHIQINYINGDSKKGI